MKWSYTPKGGVIRLTKWLIFGVLVFVTGGWNSSVVGFANFSGGASFQVTMIKSQWN